MDFEGFDRILFIDKILLTIKNIDFAEQKIREIAAVEAAISSGFLFFHLFRTQSGHGNVVVRLVKMRQEEQIEQLQLVDSDLFLDCEGK